MASRWVGRVSFKGYVSMISYFHTYIPREIFSNLTCAYFSDGSVQPPTRIFAEIPRFRFFLWGLDSFPKESNLYQVVGTKRCHISFGALWKLSFGSQKVMENTSLKGIPHPTWISGYLKWYFNGQVEKPQIYTEHEQNVVP